MTARRFILHLPGELPSRNESEAAARNSKWGAAAMKRKHTVRVAMCALRTMTMGWVPMARYHVNVEFRCKDKRKDPDNVLGALKYLLDGLQDGQIVTGDGWKNVLSISTRFTVDRDNPEVVVELVEDES